MAHSGKMVGPAAATDTVTVDLTRMQPDITRVVLAWREPPVFVPGGGAAWLADHGVLVTEVPELAADARAVNAHLLPG